MRRLPAIVFAGDRRVWWAAAAVGVLLIGLVAFYCVRPRDYYTGTDNVETYTYIAPAAPGEPVCVPGLRIPAETGRIRLALVSRTTLRPRLTMRLRLGGSPTPIKSTLNPEVVPPTRISAAVFTIPQVPSHPAERPASICLTASDVVNWGGTPLPLPPSTDPPTVGGHAASGRISVWYLPRAGQQRSYLARAGAILHRASLFRAGIVGPWLFWVILLGVLPALALASVRALAIAAQLGPGARVRRLALWVFAVAALNFVCWSIITPAFQSPDEVDHFAYTQSLVERGEAPSRNPGSPLPRWSSSESLALEDMSFFTDHQVGDTKPPWTTAQQDHYRSQVAALHPKGSDGGGNETAATHGAVYYALLAPGYVLASSSPFAQLTLMRLISALIGALTVLFAFLLARELAPGRPWLAVLAALLVAYEPMYGFISGSVNNDVGVNAGAAALELLLIVMVRRGLNVRLGLLAGAVLAVLPIVKGTAYSLYPVAAIALLITLWRHHRRADAPGWAALLGSALAVRIIALSLSGVFHPGTSGPGGPPEAGSVKGSVSEALAHPGGYLSYVWQVFLPRLPFMAPHFDTTVLPGFVIFVERGWAAFGWYDVYFVHWVYVAILVGMLAVPVLALIAAAREWPFVRRNAVEAGLLVLMPVAVIGGFEAAFFTIGDRAFIPEFGRYAFPAIAPLAVLVVASLHAFCRRWALLAGAGLLAAMMALCYASQLLTLTSFFA